MRRLWSAVVHGRHTRQAEVTASRVDELGERYQWLFHPVDNDGDMFIELRYTTDGVKWRRECGDWVMGRHSFATEVPKVQRKLIDKAQAARTKRKRDEDNRRWAEHQRAKNASWVEQNK